jgi:hypothetical protein
MRSKHLTAPATTGLSDASVEDEIAHLRDPILLRQCVAGGDLTAQVMPQFVAALVPRSTRETGDPDGYLVTVIRG